MSALQYQEARLLTIYRRQDDPNYLIIKQWITTNYQSILFEHTRRLRERNLIADSTAVMLKREKGNLMQMMQEGQAPRTDEAEKPSNSDSQESDQETVPPDDSTASYQPKQGTISAALDVRTLRFVFLHLSGHSLPYKFTQPQTNILTESSAVG